MRLRRPLLTSTIRNNRLITTGLVDSHTYPAREVGSEGCRHVTIFLDLKKRLNVRKKTAN